MLSSRNLAVLSSLQHRSMHWIHDLCLIYRLMDRAVLLQKPVRLTSIRLLSQQLLRRFRLCLCSQFAMLDLLRSLRIPVVQQCFVRTEQNSRFNQFLAHVDQAVSII